MKGFGPIILFLGPMHNFFANCVISGTQQELVLLLCYQCCQVSPLYGSPAQILTYLLTFKFAFTTHPIHNIKTIENQVFCPYSSWEAAIFSHIFLSHPPLKTQKKPQTLNHFPPKGGPLPFRPPTLTLFEFEKKTLFHSSLLPTSSASASSIENCLK